VKTSADVLSDFIARLRSEAKREYGLNFNFSGGSNIARRERSASTAEINAPESALDRSRRRAVGIADAQP